MNIQALGIRPTRIELLKLKKRQALARKGHDLLEEKMDAMVLENSRFIERYRQQKEKMNMDIRTAFSRLIEAEMVMGRDGLREVAGAIMEMEEIQMETRVIMGVKVPLISIPETLHMTGQGRGYSYTGTSVLVDETADYFERVIKNALALAELEDTIRRLEQEIIRTRRRVNALENILIPRLAATEKYIEMHLEEREREDLFRRKRTKQVMREKAESS
jgi:V/A-type H+-transporting ATPase subunit D